MSGKPGIYLANIIDIPFTVNLKVELDRFLVKDTIHMVDPVMCVFSDCTTASSKKFADGLESNYIVHQAHYYFYVTLAFELQQATLMSKTPLPGSNLVTHGKIYLRMS